ncbi:MAG TPA: AraC family transcriptional regulator, partial [Thermoanaerobaculia bacterium]
VLRGGYREHLTGDTRLCAPCTAVFHPPGEVHSDAFLDAGGRVFNAEIGDAWLARWTGDLPRPGTASPDSPLLPVLQSLYRELRWPDDLSPLTVESLMAAALTAAAQTPKSLSGPVRRARQILQERFREPILLGEVASEVGVDPAHLARAFKESCGTTMGDYTRRLRLAFALRRIAEEGSSLAGIAHEAGFADQSHFSRIFKRQTGMTPAAYRRAIHRP